MININTERLLLRPLSTNDAKDMFEYATDDEIGPYAGWTPHKTIDETISTIDFMIRENDVYAIVLKSENKMIGTLGLHKRDYDPAVKELGYVLNKAYWGNGYVTEASKALIVNAFEFSTINKIIVKHFKYNERSQRVIERLGFTYTNDELKIIKLYGIELTRETRCYELLKSDYERKLLIWQQH